VRSDIATSVSDLNGNRYNTRVLRLLAGRPDVTISPAFKGSIARDNRPPTRAETLAQRRTEFLKERQARAEAFAAQRVERREQAEKEKTLKKQPAQAPVAAAGRVQQPAALQGPIQTRIRQHIQQHLAGFGVQNQPGVVGGNVVRFVNESGIDVDVRATAGAGGNLEFHTTDGKLFSGQIFVPANNRRGFVPFQVQSGEIRTGNLAAVPQFGVALTRVIQDSTGRQDLFVVQLAGGESQLACGCDEVIDAFHATLL
jgi:hypothetical protein